MPLAWPIRFEYSFCHWIGPTLDSIQCDKVSANGLETSCFVMKTYSFFRKSHWKIFLVTVSWHRWKFCSHWKCFHCRLNEKGQLITHWSPSNMEFQAFRTLWRMTTWEWSSDIAHLPGCIPTWATPGGEGGTSTTHSCILRTVCAPLCMQTSVSRTGSTHGHWNGSMCQRLMNLQLLGKPPFRIRKRQLHFFSESDGTHNSSWKSWMLFLHVENVWCGDCNVGAV